MLRIGLGSGSCWLQRSGKVIGSRAIHVPDLEFSTVGSGLGITSHREDYSQVS